jgi:hypothetical protein
MQNACGPSLVVGWKKPLAGENMSVDERMSEQDLKSECSS